MTSEPISPYILKSEEARFYQEYEDSGYDGHHGPESWDSPEHCYSVDEIKDPVGSWALFVCDFRVLLEDHGMPLDEGYNMLRETLSANATVPLGNTYFENQRDALLEFFLSLVPALCSKFSLFDIRQPSHMSDCDWLVEVETLVGHIFEGIPIECLTPLLRQILTVSQYEDPTAEALYTKAGQTMKSPSDDFHVLTESLQDDSTRQLDSKAYGKAEICPPSSKDMVVVGMGESGFSRLEWLEACARNPWSTEALGVSDTVPLNPLSTERTVDPEHSVVPEKAGLPLTEKEVATVLEGSHGLELEEIRNLEEINNSQPMHNPVTTDPMFFAHSSNGFDIDELWDILWLKDDDLAELKQSCASNARKSVGPEPYVLPDSSWLVTEGKHSEVSQEPCASGANLADSSPSGIACSRQESTLEHVSEMQNFDTDDNDHKTARMKFPSGKVPDICGNPGFFQIRSAYQSQWLILIYFCLTWVWRSCQWLSPIMSLVISHGICHFSGRKRYLSAVQTQPTSTLVGDNLSSCSYCNRVSRFPMSLVFWDPGGCLGKTRN